MIKILFVCHGNICRSPLAHLYFQNYLQSNPQIPPGTYYIDSAATSYEEIGNPVHPGTRRKLAEAGISSEGKYARHMEKSDYRDFDLLIGMDRQNIRNMERICGGDPDKKIYKMMEFSKERWKDMAAGRRNPNAAPDVADPWYTGNFDETWDDITGACEGLWNYLNATGRIQ